MEMPSKRILYPWEGWLLNRKPLYTRRQHISWVGPLSRKTLFCVHQDWIHLLDHEVDMHRGKGITRHTVNLPSHAFPPFELTLSFLSSKNTQLPGKHVSSSLWIWSGIIDRGSHLSPPPHTVVVCGFSLVPLEQRHHTPPCHQADTQGWACPLAPKSSNYTVHGYEELQTKHLLKGCN